MSEYWPFIVLFAFAAVLYMGTIVWTEWLFPDATNREDEIATIVASLKEHNIEQRELFDEKGQPAQRRQFAHR